MITLMLNRATEYGVKVKWAGEKGGKIIEYDKITGGVIRQYAIVPIRPKAFIPGGVFMAMQDGFGYLAQQDLTGEQLKILLHIMSKLDF